MLAELCATCQSEGKYRCPACGRSSCSVNCVKQHKQDSGCTGEVDPVRFVPKASLLTELGINRDYNFLQRIGRDITVDTQSARSYRVAKPRDQWRAGVRVRAMGRGMSRVEKNRSRWNQGQQAFEWTVEIMRSEQPRIFSQVSDKTPVGDLLSMFDCPETFNVMLRDAAGQRFLLKKSDTLNQALKGRTVLEFPTLELLEETGSGDSSSGSDPGSESSSDSDSGSDPISGSGSSSESGTTHITEANNAADSRANNVGDGSETLNEVDKLHVAPEDPDSDSDSDPPLEESAKALAMPDAPDASAANSVTDT